MSQIGYRRPSHPHKRLYLQATIDANSLRLFTIQRPKRICIPLVIVPQLGSYSPVPVNYVSYYSLLAIFFIESFFEIFSRTFFETVILFHCAVFSLQNSEHLQSQKSAAVLRKLESHSVAMRIVSLTFFTLTAIQSSRRIQGFQ